MRPVLRLNSKLKQQPEEKQKKENLLPPFPMPFCPIKHLEPMRKPADTGQEL